jgi:ABC-type dipeptide/oligopeptide/nickel transport system permease component
MLDVLRQDYIKGAIAKGVHSRTLLFKHALRNVIGPIINASGLIFANNLGWSFLVELVFSWPGVGRYGALSITHGDFIATLGVVIFVSIAFITVDLVGDIIYAYIDPRIKYE